MVVRRPSRATSLAQAVRYRTNMPEAREMAARESLETLVDFGRAALRRRRMQAAGGSNSMFWEEDVWGLLLEVEDDGGGGLDAGSVVEDVAVAVAAAAAAATADVDG
mmetsp:Transcript_33292/g.56646  ORF Transcript_33292/g.56646 Transcript_33292/m.56646 type:complete len:107 (+) Transcript_33292:517-837(+)